jgi:hypothetical protein
MLPPVHVPADPLLLVCGPAACTAKLAREPDIVRSALHWFAAPIKLLTGTECGLTQSCSLTYIPGSIEIAFFVPLGGRANNSPPILKF